MSVAELAPLLKSGSISPVELVQNSLGRISQLEPTLNAFLDVWDESAMNAARIAEKEISAGDYKGPLHGIPVGLKDLVDYAGTPTTGGSKVLAENIAESDATVVTKLRDSGAIFMGKLNLVEFAFGTTGLNAHTGDV